MKYQQWLVIAAAAGLALTGCSHMGGSSDTDQSSTSSSGTMRRAESGSNTSPNPETRSSDCVPGDTREKCAPDSESSGTESTPPQSEPGTESGTPEPR